MTDVTVSAEAVEEVKPAGAPDALDDQLISQLVDRAKADGIQLTGEGGLLQQLTKRILESALEGEITDHLGHEKHERTESGNVRNGTRSKSVITDVGPVEIEVPRDRSGSFEPQIVKKRQRRLNGVDEMVLSLSARGLTHGEISAHLKEVYGAEVSKTTISTITDKVIENVGWSSFSYNQDIFDEMGVEYPTDGWTVEQYLEKALATTDADKGYWGTNHVGGGALLWMSSLPFNMNFQINSEDGRQVAGLFDSEDSINAIQFILDKEEKHKVGPNAAAMDALGNGFASGKIAIGDASTWGLKDQRELPFKWGLVRAPVVPGNDEYSWGGAVQFMMWSKAENQQNIWNFLKYASTDGSKLAHEAGQWQSPVPSVWTEVGDDQDPHLNFYLEYAKLPTQLPPYEREKFWEAVGTPYFDIWPRYLENGERPLADIVKDAAAQAQTALDDAFGQS